MVVWGNDARVARGGRHGPEPGGAVFNGLLSNGFLAEGARCG